MFPSLIRCAAVATICAFVAAGAVAQNHKEEYEKFRQEALGKYTSFREEANRRYAEFIKEGGKWFEGSAPLPKPQELNPLPPRKFPGEREEKPKVTEPEVVKPEPVTPQPVPKEPIREVPDPGAEYFEVDFYGISPKVRLPESARMSIPEATPELVSDGWNKLSGQEMDNAVRDCLETRIRYDMCDWAYINFLSKLSIKFCGEGNAATLLMAYLYSQSGYSMRLAFDGTRLVLLFGSSHNIFDKSNFSLNGISYYPWGPNVQRLNIIDYEFDGEKPLSLLIPKEQKLGGKMSPDRVITSRKYPFVTPAVGVPSSLIDFYGTYPTSAIDGNMMSRWAMYGNTPLSQKTRDMLYPKLRQAINGKSQEAAANVLLDWVQTGLVYEYDDKVWGHDRVFFAEESLFYPYADCEDRAVLFSHLVRDLLGLDVALVYYPNHLATAVRFTDNVAGDAMQVGQTRYVVCDPTYIGAPVGMQMPNLDCSKVQCIVLDR